MKKIFLYLVLIAFIIGCQNVKKESRDESYKRLSQEFIDPPVDARPHGLWCWIDGNFDTTAIRNELEEAKEKGMGGFDIWDIYPVRDEDSIILAGEPFMSPKYVDGIVYAIKQASLLGLEIGVIASSGWNCGGSWTKPENSTMVLYQSKTAVKGGNHFSGSLPFPAVPEKHFDHPRGGRIIEVDQKGMPIYFKEIAVLAYPVKKDSVFDPSEVIDLTSKMDASGKLDWDAPAGEWQIVRYVCFPSGQQMMGHTRLSTGPMIDHFSARAAEEHVRYFLDKFQKRLGPLNKTALKHLYSDSYEVHSYEIKNELIWTPELKEEFRRKAGYDLTSFIPALFGYIVKDKETTERFLYDFRKTMSDLIIENHYGKCNEVCKEYGIGFNAEAGGPGKPLHDCPFESIRALGVLNAPRGEFWHMDLASAWKGCRTGDQDTSCQVIKGIACAAHLYNKKYVEAESFTSTWLWQEGLYDFKPAADRAFCEGLNKIFFHVFPHNPRMAGKPGWLYSFGTVVSTTQTWWPKARPFMDYLARCSYLLQQGNFVADVLYYYGDEAPNFVPFKKFNPSLAGYDYDYINSDILLNKISVDEKGNLVLPHGQKYSVLVLSDESKANPSVLLKIQRLISMGATVIGPKPSTCYGLMNVKESEETITSITSDVWGNCDGKSIKEHTYGKGKIFWGKPIREILIEKGIIPDVQVKNGIAQKDIDFIHRNHNGIEIYFIRNTLNKHVSFDVAFRVTGLQPEFWNPETGNIIKNKIYKSEKEQSLIPIDLDAYGSVFVVFSSKCDSAPVDRILQDTKLLFPLDSGYERSIKLYDDGIILDKPGNYVVGDDTFSCHQLPAPYLLEGSWNVYFDSAWGGPDHTVFPKLTDWIQSTDDSIKYYSGIATYVKEFELSDEIFASDNELFLDLGEVDVIADVSINGKHSGILWNNPFVMNVTGLLHAGKNVLAVEVANRWPNRLIYDARLPREKRLSNCSVIRLPNAFSFPMKEIPNAEYSGLLPSGLVGPVKIEAKNKIKFN